MHCSALFERATHLQLAPKKMKFLFKRYLDYEKKHGDAARCARAVLMAVLMAGVLLIHCSLLTGWRAADSLRLPVCRSSNPLPPLLPTPVPAAWSTSSGGQWSMWRRRQRHE